MLSRAIVGGHGDIFRELILRGYGRFYRDMGDLFSLATISAQFDIADYILTFFHPKIPTDDLMKVLTDVALNKRLYNKIVRTIAPRKGGAWRLQEVFSPVNLEEALSRLSF